MNESLFKNVKIETDRLLLRCFTLDDKDEFYQIIQDPILYETLPEDHMYSREEVNDIIEWFVLQYSNNTLECIPKFPLAILLKENKKMIGNVGIGHYSMDKSIMEIFYFINSKYWNLGYVSEAVKALLDYVSMHKIVKRLIGTVVEKNIASKKILLNNGFKRIEHNYDDTREMYELVF